jgi:hypothetical protein
MTMPKITTLTPLQFAQRHLVSELLRRLYAADYRLARYHTERGAFAPAGIVDRKIARALWSEGPVTLIFDPPLRAGIASCLCWVTLTDTENLVHDYSADLPKKVQRILDTLRLT